MIKMIQKIKLDKKLENYLFIVDANVFHVQLLNNQNLLIFKSLNINNYAKNLELKWNSFKKYFMTLYR
jgi:hypothetical protein